MNIAIIGFGRMGREVMEVARSRGHTCTTIDTNNADADYQGVSGQSLEGADVCIDFTLPQSAVANLEAAAACKKPVVMGTTGWYSQMDHVRDIVEESGIGFLWSPNFSIGVNLYFRLVSAAASIFDNVDDYDVMGYEIHHNGKADSPSGTAIKIAQLLVDGIERKKEPVYEMLSRRREPHELHYASVRGGSNPGLHSVQFDSPFDTIEISHQNRNRQGLALGAVLAAEFVADRHGFYEIEDLIDHIIGG